MPATELPAKFGQRKPWLITLNDYTNEEVETLNSICNNECQCAAWQKEIAPTTGQRHIQCYVLLLRKQRLSFWKRHLPRAHLDAARGTPDECIAYCTKEVSRDSTPGSGPFRFGTIPEDERGKRTDLLAIRGRILDGATEQDIARDYFADYVRYHGGIAKAVRLLGTPVSRHAPDGIEVKVYWGPTGTGKSRRATAEAPDAFRIQRPADKNSTKLFEGYNGQLSIIIDDFYGWIPYDLLLRLLDRYPFRAHIHYGSVEILATRFWITSNHSPSEWYRNIGNTAALQRRLNYVELMDGGYTYTTDAGLPGCASGGMPPAAGMHNLQRTGPDVPVLQSTQVWDEIDAFLAEFGMNPIEVPAQDQ